MNTAHCEKCNTLFFREPDQYWKRLCLPCWRASKDQVGQNTENAEIEKRRMSETILRLQRMLVEKENIIAQYRKQSNALDNETLKRIRILVHPDKHNNSQISVQISQKINQMLK